MADIGRRRRNSVAFCKEWRTSNLSLALPWSGYTLLDEAVPEIGTNQPGLCIAHGLAQHIVAQALLALKAREPFTLNTRTSCPRCHAL